MVRAGRSPSRGTSVPLSVLVDPEIRSRLIRYARRTGVPLATGFRMLAIARLDEIDEEGRVSRVREWQRARSWALAQTILGGTARESSLDDLMRGHAAAVSRAWHSARAG